MSQQLSFDDEVTAVVKQFTIDEGATIVKAPRQTLVRGEEKHRGSEAFEALRKLKYDPGRLVDQGPLAAGGMSAIRVAKQVALDREVAVKRLPPAKRTPRHVEALLAESWLTGALEHPNIVPVHDLGLDEDGMPILVMKKIDGHTWGDLLRGGGDLKPFGHDGDPLPFHLRVFMQVCNATHFAHARGIVHRDLKPDNVMVGYFGEVYVVDWGIATPPKPAKSIAGTPAYLAPEMLARHPNDRLTTATDVYLLGAILFEILTGAPPHMGETMDAIVASVLKSPPQLGPEVPLELALLATACMQPNPAQRPSSAEHVRKAVERFFEHEGSRGLAREAALREQELSEAITQRRDDRSAIHALFTECRFGYRQALRTWAGNSDAKRGLERVVEAMIRYELARGDGRAAQVLLGELSSPHVALTKEVEVAIVSADDKARKLRDLERRHDPQTGNRQRRFFGLTFGLLFTLSPLVGYAMGRRSVESLVEGSIFVPVVAITLVALNWKMVTTSAITRGIMTLVAFGMSVQLVAAAASRLTGPLPCEVFLFLLPFYWAFMIGLAAVLFERRLVGAAAAFFVSGAFASMFPEWRFALIAAANFVICASAYVVWPTTRDRRADATGAFVR